MKKRAISTILTAVLLFGAVSCADGSPSNDTDASSTSQNSSETTEKDIFAGIAVQNYDGRDFNILVRETELELFNVEEETGEALDDALFRRNSLVSERFGVELNFIEIDGAIAKRQDYIASIRQSVMANDGAYDLIEGYAAVIGDGYADNLFLNLKDVDELRLDEEWWSSVLRDTLSVNGKLYAVAGDITYGLFNRLWVMYFNKDMMDDFGYEYPYQKVINGTWTYDAFLSDIKGVSSDIDGNPDNRDFNDRWGFILRDSRAVDNFVTSFDTARSVPSEDGMIKLNIYGEEMFNTAELLNALIRNNSDVYYTGNGSTSSNVTAVELDGCFKAGNAMYMSYMLGTTQELRASDVEFGIVPYPKADEAQETYYTSASDGRSMFVIPVDVKDVDFAGTITEALCVSGHEMIIPTYYDLTLKGKSVRDNESSAMLDIIRAGFKSDFAMEHALQTDGSGYVVRYAICEKNQPFASYLASRKNAYDTAFEAFLKAYE